MDQSLYNVLNNLVLAVVLLTAALIWMGLLINAKLKRIEKHGRDFTDSLIARSSESK